jgi:putative hydrolase of the HAD superfamily
MIKAVFFDLDDTLHNTTRLAKLARRAAMQAMTDKGLPLSPDEASLTLMNIIKSRGSNYPHHFDILVEEAMGEKNDKIVAAGIIAYHNTKFANMAPYRDCIPTLIRLKQMGLSLNVITNGRSIKQWEKILRLGLEAFFDHVVISENVGHSKPNPEIYQIALSLARCSPDEALFVDNSPDCIRGAKDVGMTTVLMDRTQTDTITSSSDFVMSSLTSLPALIESLK